MLLVAEFIARCALTATSAFVTYIVWFICVLMSGSGPGGTSSACPDGPLGDPPLNERVFPLKEECNYLDGRTESILPWFVNPLIFLFIGLTLICLWKAMQTLWKMADHDPYSNIDEPLGPHSPGRGH